METAPKNEVIVIRFMWGYLSSQWSSEDSCWVATPEVGGGKIPGPIYGWLSAKQGEEDE